MNIIKTSIEKPLMMIMVITAVVLFGITAFLKMPIDTMPEMDLPYVTVQSIYIGAGPDEIENTVIKPLEDQFTTITGLKNISGYCMESVGFTVLEFNTDVDADLAAIEVKDKYDQIVQNLPKDLQKPVISKFDPNSEPIIQLALSGNVSAEKLKQLAEKDVVERLVRIGGVGTISITGGREREIQVNLDVAKMSAHNLNIFMVFPVIGAQSANFPAGRITGIDREYTVRVQGEFESLSQIANLKIPTPMGYSVRLSDIAEVTDTYAEQRALARFNGKESVNMGIVKRPDGNTVEVAEEIFAEVERIKKLLPAGISLNIAEDRSDFIKNAVNDTYASMLMGIILTALILLFFLFDWRLMVIAAVTMPISIIMAMVGMSWLGFSLNIITLMALSISVGILVTNSIMVLENIVRFRDRGLEVKEAAEKGTNEVVVAVLASTLTNLAVFIPIANTTGIIGNIFKALGLTIVFATLASLFLSFTLTPLMASRMLKRQHGTKKKNAMDRAMEHLEGRYKKILGTILASRVRIALVVVATIILFLGTMKFVAPHIGSEFMPKSDQGYLGISVEMPPGTPLQRTSDVLAQIEKRLDGLPEVASIASSVGGSGFSAGVNLGQVTVKMVAAKERTRTTEEFSHSIRAKFADIPDAKIVSRQLQSMGGPSEGDIMIEVTGADMALILAVCDSVKQAMHTVGDLTDVALSWKGAMPEIKIIPNRERIEHYGLTGNIQASTTIQALGGILRFSMTGNDQAVYRENGEDYPIRVQVAPKDRDSYEDIATLPIMVGRKGFVPINAIARVEEGDGISGINRKNRQRMVSVTANLLDGTPGEKSAALQKIFDTYSLPEGYDIVFGGMQDMQNDSFKQLAIAGAMAVLLTMMVLIGILESFMMALVIWLTLPLGIIGVVWALFVTGNSFSLMANMSIVMLIGIVVNNAILMIDYARQYRKEHGVDAKEAIIEASATKLKAIIMMNLAIILAMLPQALSLGSGGEMRAPFAITAVGGVLVSTVLTLFFIPVLYVATARKKIVTAFDLPD